MLLAPRSVKPRNLQDTELARQVAARDHAAFSVLIRRHNRMLYRAARSILKDEAEAEEAVQEAYLLAYRTIGQYHGAAKLSTWLVRIVVNEAIARLRKRNRSAALSLRLHGDPDAGAAAPEQPERCAQRAQARRILQRKIDALPDAMRTVFVLRALEEMTVEEVSEALDIPQATVRTRFFRARRLLRKAMARELYSFSEIFAFAGARCDAILATVLARLQYLPRRSGVYVA